MSTQWSHSDLFPPEDGNRANFLNNVLFMYRTQMMGNIKMCSLRHWRMAHSAYVLPIRLSKWCMDSNWDL